MIHIYRGYPTTHIKDWINEHIDIDYSKIPFYIEALEDGNVKLTKNNSPNEISLVYSLDNKNWNDWNYKTGTDLKAGEKLYLKSNNDSGKFSTNSSNYYTFNFSSNINIIGNIMSLLYNNFVDKKTLTSDYCFVHLFYKNTNLIDASNLILPATTLADCCYYYMFSDCTSLTSAPELPATTLADSCYVDMFSGCTSLTSAPELPATTLADCCYFYMFSGCTSLTSAPELPATTLADSCYFYMFSGCTSLTSAPELPATTLYLACYSGMFYNCTSLTSNIILPATSIATGSYSYMFYICLKISELHYPVNIQNDVKFTVMADSPNFGATNATVYYDL